MSNNTLIVYIPSHYIQQSYRTAKGAKSAFTKMSKKQDMSDYTIMSVSEYNARDVYVEVAYTNPHSGDKCTAMLRKSEVGTCCDPSTDRYWCM